MGLSPDRIAKLGVCRTFQNIRLFGQLSVLDNVFIGNHLRLKSNVFSTVFRLPHYTTEEKEIYEKSMYLLEKIGLQDMKDEKAYPALRHAEKAGNGQGLSHRPPAAPFG